MNLFFFFFYSVMFGALLLTSWMTWLKTEAVLCRCSVEKVFLKISQNSQENTCTRVSFLIKLVT